MNTIISASKAQTMSSRDIAELTGKRHDHVMADIRKMLSDLNLHAPEFSGVYKDQQLIERPCFNLPKRETLILVSGYSVAMRAKIIDRWQELESAAPTIPQTLPEALRLAADLAEQKARVEQQLAIAAPKADALDRIADTTGVFGIREAAKALKVKQSELVTLLIERKWAYRDERQVLQGYSNRIDQGYIKHVMSAPIILNDGTERVFSQLKITSAGVTRLSQIISKTTKAA